MAVRSVATERFGELTIDSEEIIHMPDGMVGFVAMNEVTLLPVDPDGLFFWLQAVNDPALAFLVLTPWPLFPDYTLDLADPDQAALDLDDPGDALVFCVVTSHEDPRRFTANLVGPVVINTRLRRGRQVVLEADLPTQADLPLLLKS